MFLAHKSLHNQRKHGAAGSLTALKWFTKFVGCSDSTLQAESINEIVEGDKLFFVQERVVSDDLTPELFNRHAAPCWCEAGDRAHASTV